MPELSEYFVNPKGLLCYQLSESSVIDVDMYLIPIFNGFTGEVFKDVVAFKPALYSIYTDNQTLFIAAQDRFGLFEGEKYIRGLYSSEYILTQIDYIINKNYED